MFERIVQSVNLVGDHVWSIVVITLGAVAAWRGHQEVGMALVSTGALMWRGGKSE